MFVNKEYRPLTIESFGVTDKGKKRLVNEDGFVINERLGLYLVVDGMGGNDAGMIAGKTVLNALQSQLESFVHKAAQGDLDLAQYAKSYLTDALAYVNSILYEMNVFRGYAEGSGMGAVVSGIWWIASANLALVFHVGDSRVYLFRESQLEQLTVDHTMYQLWKMKGGAGAPPPRNVIFRALGARKELEVDIKRMELVKDDVALICSDGLTNMVDSEALNRLFECHALQDEGDGLSRTLVARALDNGGLDNITAVTLRVA